MAGTEVRYGSIDFDYAKQLATTPAEDDGPVWMVNLMRYRPVADYSVDAPVEGAPVSGREADDRYLPTESLAGVGAQIVFGADVETQLLGDAPQWDRVGVVKYPTRRSFIEMQSRPDFQDKHTHKEAGMDHTIVFGVAPRTLSVSAVEGRSARMVFDLVRHDRGPTAPTSRQAVGPVEGTILGDGRAWTELRISWLGEGDDLPAADEVTDRERVVVHTTIDRLPTLIAAAVPGQSPTTEA